MDDDGDICAVEGLMSGIEPELVEEILKIANDPGSVFQVLLDTDCLNWSDLYQGDTDVRAFIASFNERLINETGNSVFDGNNTEVVRALPHLFIKAKQRFEQTLSSVNAGNGNPVNREFIPFRREIFEVKTEFGESSECRYVTPNTTKFFTANRDIIDRANPVSDFRSRRLSPALGYLDNESTVSQATDTNADTVAELWAINSQLRPVSKLIQVLESDNLTKERVPWLTFESIHSRLTSIASIRRQMKHISDLIKYTVIHFGSVKKLQGQISAVIIRDFLIHIKTRGHTVPLAARAAISTWAETLQIDWKFNDNLVKSAMIDQESRKVAQAPPFRLEFLVKLEKITQDDNIEIGLKLFASAILLTVHDSLRFSDIQRIATFNETDDVIHGTLAACKVKKQHGLPWPFAAVRRGFLDSGVWHKPIMDFRHAYYSAQKVLPTFTIPIIDDEWAIQSFEPANYNIARRRLLMLAIRTKEKNPDAYALHSGKILPNLRCANAHGGRK